MALLGQAIVAHEPEIARKLADAAVLELAMFPTPFIREGDSTNDLFLIVTGEVSVQVKGREVARRYTNQHVGELAVIDPTATRSATVMPVVPSVLARLSEQTFSTIANQHPEVWRRLALDIGDRLRERNNHVRPRRDRPVLFIGSSKEALPLATALKDSLADTPVSVTLWSEGVFEVSRFPIEDLETQLGSADFAVLVTTPDDRLESRRKVFAAPRDNIVFELGLFMGALTRHRTMILCLDGTDTRLPSDLLGITTLRCGVDASKSLAELLAGARKEILRRITSDGTL
jgi:CRP/FNR family cyclic AMP-dependent transcriptional regulator